MMKKQSELGCGGQIYRPVLKGGDVMPFLLEKSRVTHPAEAERCPSPRDGERWRREGGALDFWYNSSASWFVAAFGT